MAGKTVEFDENTEVGGFNPERRREQTKEQVGPAPTDDPRHKAGEDLREKVAEKSPKARPE